jgi:hypothetical protein
MAAYKTIDELKVLAEAVVFIKSAAFVTDKHICFVCMK